MSAKTTKTTIYEKGKEEKLTTITMEKHKIKKNLTDDDYDADDDDIANGDCVLASGSGNKRETCSGIINEKCSPVNMAPVTRLNKNDNITQTTTANTKNFALNSDKHRFSLINNKDKEQRKVENKVEKSTFCVASLEDLAFDTPSLLDIKQSKQQQKRSERPKQEKCADELGTAAVFTSSASSSSTAVIGKQPSNDDDDDDFDWKEFSDDTAQLEYEDELSCSSNGTHSNGCSSTVAGNRMDCNGGAYGGVDSDSNAPSNIETDFFNDNEQILFEVLCGNRVSQMTRAYDDIEAVTRLLEEKEKDLELTVQIGKELLTQNNVLESRINDLETDLKSSNDDRAQLLHELHKKNELIAVLTNDGDDTSEAETPNLSKSITVDLLNKKIASLQDENKSLKMEASQLANQTDAVEEHERQLMEDISAQMNEANSQFGHLSLELERQREENRLQHEQIVSLTARLAEAEMRLHQLTHDNDEHVTLLNITKENQNSLALELVEFKQRYQEVLALLQETQEQLRKQRKKSMPQARSSFLGMGMVASSMGGGMLQPDSLQSELMESSMYSENSLDSGIAGETNRANDRISRMMASQLSSTGYGSMAASTMGASGVIGAGGLVPPYKRIFDTVRCATKNGNYSDSTSMSQIGAMSMSSTSGPRMSAMAYNANPAGSFYRNSVYDGPSMGMIRTLSSESLTSQNDECYPTQPAGVPGAPGAKDLEAALKRLTPAEVLARRAMLSYGPAGTYNYDEPPQAALPLGVRTPDSIMSTGSSRLSSSSATQWRLPEKLQIVKPIEGSQTLHHWSRLATPTLSGLLEERPGVTIRGGRGLEELGMQVYTLSDVEEDMTEELPGKQFDVSSYTYTYTTCVVMHPDDGIVNDLSFLSQSQMSSRMASTSTSRQPSCPPTPRSGLSRKNSCSTFSVNLGLASMLNERGIKAITPSALNTPAGPNFSPTVTPCNSPEGSPPRSNSPEPMFSGILSSGADLIRRKLVGGDINRINRNQQQRQQQQQVMLSRLERRALRSLRLLDKLESIGLENIIATTPSNSGIASRSCSPATSLKNLHTNSNNIVDDIRFDRDQIKGVLHRGLKSPSQSTAAAPSSISSRRSVESGVSGSGGSDSDSDGGIVLKDVKKKSILSSTATAHASATKSHSSSSSTSSLASSSVNVAQIAEGTTPMGTHHQPLAANNYSTSNTNNATDARIKQMQRQKSRRNLKNGMASQRPDLGTIGGGRVRPDLGKVSPPLPAKQEQQQQLEQQQQQNHEEMPSTTPQSFTQSFVGSVSSLLFGRKGGWL